MDREAQPVLAWLREPDEMTLAFNPYGLGGRLAPDDAADFQMASIARAVLAEDVPENVRDNFERARKLHLYGVLEYEFFTAASDYALLVLEGALRVRFLAYYTDGIPVLRSQVQETLQPRSFDDIRDARGVKLRDSDGRAHRLPVSGSALLEWARRERLLPGTRSRIVDGALSNLRNHAAHPTTYSIGMPPESARTLSDVAEVINRLWGHDTPRGRLFPGPIQREVRVAAVAPNRGGARELRLEQVREATNEEQRWHYAVFLAAEPDGLTGITRGGVGFLHQPGFQTTEYPCEQLWQGDWGTLVKVIDGGAFTGANDAVRHLDRLFFIRASKGEVDLPRSPADLLTLAPMPAGVWYAVIADSPLHAWVHVRDHEPDVANGPEVCPECFVQIKARREPGAQMLVLARRLHHQH